ncbi:MAG: hypothetical protein AAF367_11495 [Pseudomonadota bacterium]
MLTRQDKQDGAALLILRAGLVWFIFLWAAHKVITPKQYQGLARHFDGLDVSFLQIYLAAGAQILLCVLALIGIFRLFSYSALMVMHFFTVTRRWEGFFDPFALNERGFPIHRNQVIDLAVLAAFVALILLIRRDHFSLGAWFARQRGALRWWM